MCASVWKPWVLHSLPTCHFSHDANCSLIYNHGISVLGETVKDLFLQSKQVFLKTSLNTSSDRNLTCYQVTKWAHSTFGQFFWKVLLSSELKTVSMQFISIHPRFDHLSGLRSSELWRQRLNSPKSSPSQTSSAQGNWFLTSSSARWPPCGYISVSLYSPINYGT